MEDAVDEPIFENAVQLLQIDQQLISDPITRLIQ